MCVRIFLLEDDFFPKAWYLFICLRGLLGKSWSSLVTSEFVYGTDLT